MFLYEKKRNFASCAGILTTFKYNTMKKKFFLLALCTLCLFPFAWGQSDTTVNMNNYIKLRVKNPGDTVVLYLSAPHPGPSKRGGWSFFRPLRVEYNDQVIQRSFHCHVTRLEMATNGGVERFGGRVVCFGVDSTITVYGDAGVLALRILYQEHEELIDERFARVDSSILVSSIANRRIKSIEVHNDSLQHLWCKYLQVEDIHLDYAPSLYSIICQGNLLTSLDFSNAKNITNLNCRNNQLTSLEGHSRLGKLRYLFCDGNQLTTLDLRNCGRLYYVSCSYNRLTSFLSPNGRLLYFSDLDVSHNYLESLDLSFCPDLDKLRCSDNRLSTLDLSRCRRLSSLVACHNNQLETITFSACINATLYNNKLRTIHIPDGTRIIRLDAYNNLLSACALDSLFYKLAPVDETTAPQIVLHTTYRKDTLSNPGAFTCRDYIAREKGYDVIQSRYFDANRLGIHFIYKLDEPIVNTDYACAVDVEEISAKAVRVKAYPNPVQDRLYFETGDKILSIEVFDMQGRSLPLDFQGNHFIDCASWHAGIYLLKMTTDKGIETFKITKK